MECLIFILLVTFFRCIETIISERMRQISDTLNDIDILDVACHTASSRLSSIRHSKVVWEFFIPEFIIL